jgi:hypothetical protein
MVRKIGRSTNHLSSDGHLLGAEESILSSIQETGEHVKEARVLRPPLETEDDYTLAETKMRRALDRLKRATTKAIDAPGDMASSSGGIIKAVRTLSMDIATTMEALLSPVRTVLGLAVHSCLIAPTIRDPYQKTTLHCLIFFLFWRGLRLLQTIPSQLTQRMILLPGRLACLAFNSPMITSAPSRFHLPRQ